ncbi:MAG TPA: glycosyltransferase [Actinomycetota bacterium]|nr:glycosyltransferase [Actinomycetota bacterium]
MTDVRRLAVLTYHSSPLVEPGAGDAGGMTVYVRELATALAEQGVLTDIFTRATGDLPRIASFGEGIRVIAIEAGPHRSLDKSQLEEHLSDFVSGIRSFSIGQRLSYDLVHSHYWHSGLAGRELAQVWGVPLVHSHHTLGRVKNRWLAPGDSPEPDERIAGEAEVVEGADVLVASTEEERTHLQALYGAPEERLKVLPPGVDHNLFVPGDRAEARADLGLGEGPLLLSVGRIQKLKGMDLSIRVVAELKARGVAARLLIVGGESGRLSHLEAGRLRALTRELGVDDLVVFAGRQPHIDLPLYYQAADALLVSSHSESFGLAALEAQACGVPVIGTRVGGLPHLVAEGESGFIVDERDPSRLADRVQILFDDPDGWESFSRAARARAAVFSWKRSAEAFLELYECLVREPYPEACTC